MNETDYTFYLVKSCYYISTTVNIIGYGELAPFTSEEKIAAMVFEFLGLIMALYFLGQFIEIIINTQKSQNSKETLARANEIELQGWLILMQRYRDNKSI